MTTWTLPAWWAARSSRAMRARSVPFLVWAALGAGLGQGLAVGTAVHVDVLHADQAGPAGLGGGQDAGLEGGEQFRPLVVGRVEGLVDDPGAAGGGGGEGGGRWSHRRGPRCRRGPGRC